MPGWTTEDTTSLFDQLDTMKAALLKGLTQVQSAPPITNNQSSAQQINTSMSSVSGSDNIKSANLGPDACNSMLRNPPALPAETKSYLSQIEHYTHFNSNIPFGEPAGYFADYFTIPFRLAEPYDVDEVWETLNGQLDVQIGIDELPRKLWLGPHGFNASRNTEVY
ncbi:hypothetical protein CROQUDRAFT_101494 [Cronartium quercuum f. sp. fusiforme G11]|uniref:Uncharacterized protein n=1 Tax=Cronartium quercuum f. sp. fusiforme G11 TaxID=708437 RepID=A0A9P6N916_9BASI|nr:hypothetical protein CROQUDRAFT_101494 [Cronartium quercuum f. sp. fusiforme G11]